MLFSFFLLALGGLVGGLLSGMLGIGGGIVVVPLLIYLLPLMNIPAEFVVPMAVGTSLATIVVTAASSSYSHHRKNLVLWNWVRLLAPFLIIGGILGGIIGANIDPALLQRIFATVLLLLAVRMIWKLQPTSESKNVSKTTVRTSAVGIGLVSSLVGIGGGALVVPLLHYFQLAMRNAVAVAAVCSVTVALFGAITYIWTGLQANTDEVSWALGYIYLPALLGIGVVSMLAAPLGARLAHKMPVRWLQRAFAMLLVVVSVHLFVSV